MPTFVSSKKGEKKVLLGFPITEEHRDSMQPRGSQTR
jgi:hypothetical protein